MRGVVVGRFQPFHRGHLGLLRAIREERPADELLVVIGSAEQSFTWENPFTAGERFAMIELACRDAGLERIEIVPVEDIHRHAQWVAYLVGLLPPFETVYTNNPLTRTLFERGGVRVVSPPLIERERWEGERLRTRMANGEDVARDLPGPVAEYLRGIRGYDRLRLLFPRPNVAAAPAARP